MKKHRLEVHILTLFLSLLTVALVIVISYNYFRNSKSILEFSKGTAERTGSLIMQKILCMTEAKVVTNKWAANLDPEYYKIEEKNTALIDFLLSQAKTLPHFYGQAIGDQNGSFIEVGDLTMLDREQYVDGVLEKIPKETKFILRIIDRSVENPKDRWFYIDQDLKRVSEQTFEAEFDPRARDWYIGATRTYGPYWTDAYEYITNQAPIISVSESICIKGKQIGVAGSLIPINKFGGFLDEQKIGKTGRAAILDQNGKILIPVEIGKELEGPVNQAFQTHQQTNQTDFNFKNKGREYLAYVKHFPPSFKENWLLVIIVPLEDFFGDLLQTQIENVLISLLILILCSLLVIFLSKRISSPIVQLSKEVDKIKNLELEGKIDLKSHIKEIILLESSINATKVILRSFVRYIPKSIVRKLMQQGKEIELGGEKKEVTIFFSDIVGFTSITETLPADDLMPLLSEYFEKLTHIILKNEGTIDKYIGDSIMAFWGAPIETAKQGYLACLAALECKKASHVLNDKRKKEGKTLFETRFGVNSGLVFVGNIGTDERMNYTILGDAVNLAERLQEADKVYHTEILVGQNVVEKWREEFIFRPIDFATIKGKHEKQMIYELLDTRDGPKELKELAETFTKGFAAYHFGNLEAATQYFNRCLEMFPNDSPAKIYLERINQNRSKNEF